MSAAGDHTEKQVYGFGPFRLDPDKQTLLRDGEPVALAPKTFQLLLTLVRHGTETVSKDELMKSVWPDTFVEETNLTRNIFALRKALGESEQNRYIVTVPGRGYRLTEGARLLPEREVSIIAETHSKVVVEVRKTNPWPRVLLVFVILLTVAGAIWMAIRRRPVLTERDTVVLADFANTTGDPVFDGTLRQGLEVQLEQSPFLSMVPEPRVRQTLGQMGQPPDARLAGETAREVCERTGAVATVEGTIAVLGSQYVLGLVAKNCHTGVVLDQEQEQAPRKEDVLNALSAMASRFRRRVGESLASVQKYSTPLAEGTTSSLEALKAYSAAWQVHAAHGAIASLPLFQRATELDPNFALAHASLGRIYADLDQPDLAMASVERSWQLRDRANDAERFFITVGYEMLVTGNMEAAQQIAEVWARTYPREPRAHLVLAGMINKAPGRYEIGAAEAKKAIEVGPDFWIGYGSLAVNNLCLGRLREAENALSAAFARGLDADELVMAAYDVAFLKGDQAGLQAIVARAHARPGGDNWMSAREGFVAAFSGHLKAARTLSQRAVLQAEQAGQAERASLWEAGAAVREALFGNSAAATEHALAASKLGHDREVEYGAAIALALSGESARAQAIADDLQTRSPNDTCVRFSYLPVLRSLLEMGHLGRPETALEILQVAAPHELGLPRSAISGLFGALYPVYVRGLIYLRAKQGDAAAVEFRKIIDHPGIVIDDPIGALARLQLGRAYALAGDKTKARAGYDDFLKLWKDADPDVPVLRQAQSEYASLR